VDTEQNIKITPPNLARFTKNGITLQRLKQKGALEVAGLELIEELEQMKRYLSTREVMKLISVRRTTLCAWVRAGKISAIRIGHGYLFDPHILARWLAEREAGSRSPRRAA
jgi:excisionase family DNA binding protein